MKLLLFFLSLLSCANVCSESVFGINMCEDNFGTLYEKLSSESAIENSYSKDTDDKFFYVIDYKPFLSFGSYEESKINASRFDEKTIKMDVTWLDIDGAIKNSLLNALNVKYKRTGVNRLSNSSYFIYSFENEGYKVNLHYFPLVNGSGYKTSLSYICDGFERDERLYKKQQDTLEQKKRIQKAKNDAKNI